ncbi:hypothetical protein ABW636_17215 [Aquimarina sp. 2201CG1-2-11]|uniref:hypothetical protein n=1 Tax=Aquimarina discodermiae TaxID=3231043 RepID=UPI0034632AAE
MKTKVYFLGIIFSIISLSSCEKEEDFISSEQTSEENINDEITTLQNDLVTFSKSTYGGIYNTYADALTAVRRAKSKWGFGVSALIIFGNQTTHELDLVSTGASWGNWNVKPNAKLPPKKYTIAFGVKTSGAATGFEGHFSYQNSDAQLIGDFAYDSPFSGSNRIGLNLDYVRNPPSPIKWTSSNVIENREFGEDGHLYLARSIFKENTSSPLIYTTLTENF